MKATLTDLGIRSLKEGVHFDTKLPAFGIRIGKLKKTWLVVRGKERLQTVIGHYPTMSLADARTAARRLLTEAAPEKTVSITFTEARKRYLTEHTGRASTKKELTRLLTNRFAKLDTEDLADITDTDIQKHITDLPPSEGLHAFRAVRAMLNWCTKPPRRYVKASPLAGYAPPSKDKKRSRILSDDEIKCVLRAAQGQCGAIIRLVLLWGTRKGETLALRRSWIADDTITIPAENTKGARPHTIPILPLAQSIIDSLPERGDYLFAGERKHTTHINSATWTRMHRKLMKDSETKDWSLHDLRRTFRSACARLGIRRELAEILLNHAQGTLDEIYDRYDYKKEKIEALAKIEEWINTLKTSVA